ncbi:tautomerase family protein [uncultured Cohaesibacter sp.]|uniref:tautomerase family protein n=1 Tax=uncultured Cohaesibacter sp. TaxID=1002546 RepID=UPI0029C88B4E|nr:tautomerase family protein [uncultured Cohaesibacter sp.]
MPVITMTLGKEQINEAQKRAFIQDVTALGAKISGIAEQSFIVFVEELETDNIGVGGTVLSDKLRGR